VVGHVFSNGILRARITRLSSGIEHFVVAQYLFSSYRYYLPRHLLPTPRSLPSNDRFISDGLAAPEPHKQITVAAYRWSWRSTVRWTLRWRDSSKSVRMHPACTRLWISATGSSPLGCSAGGAWEQRIPENRHRAGTEAVLDQASQRCKLDDSLSSKDIGCDGRCVGE